jgi:hypothetical protein
MAEDKRLKVRFALELRAEAERAGYPRHVIHGQTTNLSSSGFTLIPSNTNGTPLNAGDRINFEIEVSKAEGSTPAVLLCGTGLVVRISEREHGPVVAVKIRRKQLVNDRRSPSEA